MDGDLGGVEREVREDIEFFRSLFVNHALIVVKRTRPSPRLVWTRSRRARHVTPPSAGSK
jgi:hypothetical protein